MKAGPLMSWDIFMSGYHRTMQRLDDWQKLKQLADEHAWRIDWDLEEMLVKQGKVALVTDTAQIIRFATDNMFDMNGYTPEEIIGKKPSIFQGDETSVQVRKEIRMAIQQLKPFRGTLINYRKDGTIYNCEVEEYPVFTIEKKHTHFIAFERIYAA
jgi:PAS domain S-box-containing protein